MRADTVFQAGDKVLAISRYGLRARAASPADRRGSHRGSGLLSEFDPEGFGPEGVAPGPEGEAALSGASADLPVPAVVPRTREHARPVAAPPDLDPAIQPSRVMARSMVVWGWGHRSLGERRGVLLLAVQVAWLVALAASLPLLQTDRWILVFGLLSGYLLVWVLQSVAAQRLAVRRSGRSTGAALLVGLVPLALAAQTTFWLIGGSTASPAATFARYIGAWETHHPEIATDLFVTPRDAETLSAAWQVDDGTVVERVDAASASNPTRDLDEDHPFSNLRFVYQAGSSASSGDRAVLEVQIVRLATVPTTFFGLFPATRSETQTVATIGQAVLVRHPTTALSIAAASVWLIESVTIDR